MRLISQHCIIQYKKKYDKRVEPDLFRLVKVLGFGSSLVGGEQFSRLLLKTDHINT